MMVCGMFVHPFLWVSVVWGAFALSPAFRSFLWIVPLAPWRNILLELWGYTVAHPGVWLLGAGFALAHVVVRFTTSHFSFNEDYLFVQTGLLSLHAPGGPLRVFNDPIAFSTIVDVNAQKGLLGLLTGTGTLFVATADNPRRYIRLTWVPQVTSAQDAILSRAGIRKARMLSSVRAGG